jgi:hypothetical protein
MKYLKTYESIREYIKKGDLIISEEKRDSNSYVYLVLDDVLRVNRKLKVYCIGYFKYETFDILSNNDYLKKLGIHTMYKREDVRLLEEDEKENIVHNIYSRIDNIYYIEALDKIKNESGIDLRDMKEYVDYLDKLEMEKNAKKYNI